MRFKLRTLFWIIAVCAVVVAVGARAIMNRLIEQFVTSKVESLNGAVTSDFPPGGVSFSVPGLSPLVRDSDLKDISPLLAKLKVRTVALVNTNVTDEGINALLDSCQDTLTSLDLTGTAISDISLSFIPKLKNLHTISFSSKVLTDRAIRALQSSPSIRKLYIYGARRDDDRVKVLENALKGQVEIETREQRSIFE